MIGLIPENAYYQGLRWAYNLKSPNSITTKAPFPGPLAVILGTNVNIVACTNSAKCKECEGIK